MDQGAELEKLKLGELYHRACGALGSVPQQEVAEALNSDDPREALIKMIVCRIAQAQVSEAGPAEISDNMPMFADGLMSLDAAAQPGSNLEMAGDLEAMFRRAEGSPAGTKVWHWIRAIAEMSFRRDAAQISAHMQAAHVQLRQALAEQQHLAAKRLADRRSRQAISATELQPIIKKKLAAPDIALSPEESRTCLVTCIEHGKAQAMQVKGKSALVVLGNTGAGKSAFINLLHGCTFELNSEDKMSVSTGSQVRELMKIGHTNKSETFAPQVEGAARSFGEDYAYADCPGFLDNRGFEINVANAVNVKQTVAAATSVRVVVIINYHSLLADRGKGVKDLFHILSSLFGSVDNVKKHANSVLLAISQAPIVHPETGAAMTLDRHREKLLDPSGLDETAKALLSAIGDAKVIIYHLLERGDPTWLKRNAIIAIIKGMVPITDPGSIFQSVINDADKESLRNLVSELGKEVEAAIASAEYDDAADVVSDLLELNLVEHGFVTQIVDDVISNVIAKRMATMRTIMNRRAEPEGADGNSQENAIGVDAEEFDDARFELRNMSFVLFAFAGIAEVREKLEPLLIEAACQLEAAVKAAAEDAGRKDVEESLREVLRTVGENAVREVLELPKAAAAMKAKQLTERSSMEELQAEELQKLLHELAGAASGTEQLDALKDRHAIQLRTASYRAVAANDAWQGHIEHAGTKLEQRDLNLLAEDGPAFWAKVGWSSERLRSDAATMPVRWGGKGLTDPDCEVMSTVFRQLEASPRMLVISTNAIGDLGITALSDATYFGALAQLEKLYANNNRIGDAGMTKLSDAIADGRLAALKFVDLNSNLIGDLGMTALAGAVANGALAALETLYLHSNKIGDAGTIAFTNSLSTSSATLAKLEKLWLYNNRIGDLGMKALSEGLTKGMLASLKSLQLEGNLAGNSCNVQQSILERLNTKVEQDQQWRQYGLHNDFAPHFG